MNADQSFSITVEDITVFLDISYNIIINHPIKRVHIVLPLIILYCTQYSSALFLMHAPGSLYLILLQLKYAGMLPTKDTLHIPFTEECSYTRNYITEDFLDILLQLYILLSLCGNNYVT